MADIQCAPARGRPEQLKDVH